MGIPNRELYKVWSLRLSIFTSIMVVLLSILNEIGLLDILLRALISFGVMYLLLAGSLNLFERTAPPSPEESQPDSNSGFGDIDFSVGEDEPLELQKMDLRSSGQIDRDLSLELPGSERQAEIVRRMGWDK
ncbi:hypothetical protein Desor_4869 [Desulfosporosinus orientis DSM 765]|uniref:Uncharacterized protein n=1 Tax=Desulfosporosinus orientis (strain ATCC 19365 / DSM 765 / NCIMB 8382 / VKM B-1628 / Singapore I) TaxID=768706 RepID=G7WHX3_DESOD|nr:hypothetical protein [Desulfosporosinus orientis]AET70270.1 hypothetical protein Desor_4869 [Desulfosporosinus orientis DSM 765]